jgi:hypothetical protein
MAENNLLQDVEERLSSNRPFGETDYLDKCTTELYRTRLDILSEHLPEAHSLLVALSRSTHAAQIGVLRDPVVRS